jgi:curved DNA-binding protein CbpA
LKAIKQDEFQKVQMSYELLSDEQRRKEYDGKVRLYEPRKVMGKGGSMPAPWNDITAYYSCIYAKPRAPPDYAGKSRPPEPMRPAQTTGKFEEHKDFAWQYMQSARKKASEQTKKTAYVEEEIPDPSCSHFRIEELVFLVWFFG